VRLKSILKNAGKPAIFLAVIILSGSAAESQVRPQPTLIVSQAPRVMPIAGSNNLYCAGYVQTSPVNTDNRLVGGLEEQDKFAYAESDFVYINMGAGKGVHEGDMFAVIRPRGEVKSHWSNKDNLGFYVEEVGALEVVRVKPDYSVAQIRTSCSSFLLGDLVQPIAVRTSPIYSREPVLDRFADPSGKARGRIIMGRDNQEMLSRDQIIYVDLGGEDSVQVGDRLTVFRPLGKGNVLKPRGEESVSARDGDFASEVYRGSRFSNQAPRKSGDTADGRVVTTEKAKKGRPDIRKVVGEAVVLKVREKMATAVITKTAQEIHTGDWVEIQ
jgi:hypothetical protein